MGKGKKGKKGKAPADPVYDHKLALAKMKRTALRMRRDGHSYDEIARRLKVATSRVSALVKDEIARLPREAAIEYREIEMQRLDRAQAAIDAKIAEGNFDAVSMLIRLVDQRAKLTGIYKLPDQSDASADVKKTFAGLMAAAGQFAADHAAKHAITAPTEVTEDASDD